MVTMFDRLAAALAHRYTIEHELGSGGMATVYLAHDAKHGRKVAIKVLRPELAATLGVERFVREIEIAAKLTHPHILPLFDSGEADAFLYYVMPYVEGESLRDRLTRDGRLSVEEAVDMTRQIASALTYAHERGVIHRDIKPENILLAGDQAIVADFGIARAVAAAGGENLTGTGLAIGTPAYMSPEQAMGSQQVDATTDVYALGCVVHEMLVGRAPFEGSTPQALLAQHAMDTVPSMRTHDPEIPARVERTVERALSKAPVDRYTTAADFAQALAGASTPEAQIAEARRVARRRWVRGLVAAGAAAVLALGGWWVSGRLATQPIEQLAVLPASNMTRDTAQDYFVDGVHEALVAELQRAGMAVIARQSVLRYRNTDKPVREIAAELGVDALIQPSVGRDGDSVIVDVSLYHARSQLPLWSASFPARVEGVLGLYRDITRRIADEVGAVISGQAAARLAERPTVDPHVYDAVLKGHFHRQRFTPEDFTIALRYFEQALAIDSLYVPAHVGAAWVWGSRAQIGVVSSAEARRVAADHVATALRLDPDVGRVRFLESGFLVWGDWDLEAGEAEFRRALDLDPNDAEVQVLYGHVLAMLGRWEEAVEHGDRARKLDPLNPFVHGLHGSLLVFVRRLDEAISVLEDMIAKHPGAQLGVDMLGDAYHAAGRHAEALQLYSRIYGSLGHQDVADALARGVETGDFSSAWEEAARVMTASTPGAFVGTWAVANFYGFAGAGEQAMDWLGNAVREGDQNVPYMGVMPAWWDLHDHPRFRRLAQGVGVPLVKPEGS